MIRSGMWGFCDHHGTGFDLAYGSRDRVSFVQCLNCGEEFCLRLSTEDEALLLQERPDANQEGGSADE